MEVGLNDKRLREKSKGGREVIVCTKGCWSLRVKYTWAKGWTEEVGG